MKNDLTTADDVQLVSQMTSKLLADRYSLPNDVKLSGFDVVSRAGRMGGEDLCVTMQLAKGVTLEIRHWWEDAVRDLESLTDVACSMAEAISDAANCRQELAANVVEIKSVVAREAAKGRRRGIPYRVESVRLHPVDAYLGSGNYWVLAEIETLATTLRPEISSIQVETVEDVVETFAQWRDEQKRRAEYRAAFDILGVTGEIDSVVVNALKLEGHDMGEVVAQLGTDGDHVQDVGGPGDASFRLYWDEGQVFSRVEIAKGVSWSKGTLYLDEAPADLARAAGRRLRDVLDLPVFGDDVVIRDTLGTKGNSATLFCNRPMLRFNSSTGRLWAA